MAFVGTGVFPLLTLHQNDENGRPLSRAKAYRLREPSACRAAAQKMPMTVMRLARKQLAPTDCVESRKICRRGTPVGVVAVSCRLPMQKQIETRKG